MIFGGLGHAFDIVGGSREKKGQNRPALKISRMNIP